MMTAQNGLFQSRIRRQAGYGTRRATRKNSFRIAWLKTLYGAVGSGRSDARFRLFAVPVQAIDRPENAHAQSVGGLRI